MTGKRLLEVAAFGAAFAFVFFPGCSRKAPQAGPAAPEVLVTTVQPQDVPVIKERVATLDGLVNATITARVSGRIVPLAAAGQRTAKLVKGAQLVVIKGGPHCITWTHADEVNDELLAFFKA